MTKQELLKEIDSLCHDINDWVISTDKARLDRDLNAIRESTYNCRTLLVDCNQKLLFIRDFINDNLE